MDFRALLKDVPEVFQYVIVLAVVMLLLYFCLTVTRLLGQKLGKKQYYDNPEEYEKSVPNFPASGSKRKKGQSVPSNPEDSSPSKSD